MGTICLYTDVDIVNKLCSNICDSIKKPKTSRYPSLKGTDPKFRRNHRHALHGTAKALVGPVTRTHNYTGAGLVVADTAIEEEPRG